MIRAAKQIIVCALALLVFCIVCRLTVFNTYTAYIPVNASGRQNVRGEDARLVIEKPDVLSHGKIFEKNGYLRVPIRPEGRGETGINISDPSGNELGYKFLRVDRFLTVYDESTGGFTGDTAVMIAVTAFWLLVSAIMLWHFFRAKGPAFYAYSTIYYAGFSLFALVTGVLMLSLTMRHILHPEQYSMFFTYQTINGASMQFMMLTLPLIVLFALAMAVSNAALLRHERFRLQNVLGILVSVLLIAGEAVGWYLYTRNFSGPEWEGRLRSTLENVYATVFVYFECMLVGSVICGVKAAKRQPAFDKDFIIILGCWFRKDGSLPPLLRGRVDRAIAFWRGQKESGGKEAVMIPSGGQGRDETMPEAEAMRRYLIAQGIPDRLIRPETQAQNTYQNMTFSQKIIREMRPEGKAVFATTNYHVFRSGLWAAQAGLKAEGIGGKTKWWFWPNAFMRECVGLLQRRWKQELLLLLLLMAFFGVLSMIL